MKISPLHLLEADHDSFGNVLQPAGLEDLLKDVRHGWHARAVVAQLNQERAQAEHSNAMIGKHFAIENTYDQLDFFDWGLREGFECWDDEQFVREHSRDVPECVVRSRPRRTSIIVPATQYTRLEPRQPGENRLVAKQPPEATRIVARPSPEATRIVAKP